MIRTKIKKPEIVIDLTGLEGNAFILLGYASHLGRHLGLDADRIVTEMMAGDYEHLIRVFDGYFGHFVVLER